MPRELTVARDDDGRRLDRILRKCLPDLPLSAIHRLLRSGKIRVDGKKGAASDRLSSGSVLTLPDLENAGTLESAHVLSQPCAPQGLPPLEIVFENEDILVLNKAEGMPSHGENSLEDAVRAYLEPKLQPSLSFRPGPLHRLDQGTSGLIAFSASLRGARLFSAALRERRVRKLYLALLDGALEAEERWEDNLFRDEERRVTDVVEAKGLHAKRAVTRVVPVATNGRYTLARIELGTGRTHQIRAQAAAHGHPLAGDRKYGGSPGPAFLLHAQQLRTESGLGLDLPSLLIAPPGTRFVERCKELFGADLARELLRLPSLGPNSGDIL